MSLKDYGFLMKLEETHITPSTHSSHHASTFGLGIALLASLCGSLIIDLGVFSHMQVHNPPTYPLIQIITTFLCFYCGWSCLFCCRTWQGQSDLFTLAISSPLSSQFPRQPLIYQRHHQSLILLHLILSLSLHLSKFMNGKKELVWGLVRKRKEGGPS